MFQFKKLPLLFCRFIFICFSMFYFCGTTVHAMKVGYYPYDKVKSALPKEYQQENYLYKLSNGDPCIAFATYNNADYKTSVKKQIGVSDYLYCIDHTKHITFKKTYSEEFKFFDNELLVRLAIALEYGPSQWGKKANAKFTTGNSILDYYMTQVVIHSLIYDFGNNKSNLGIDYSLLSYKANMTTLKKKTNAFYKFCKNADVTQKDQYFKTNSFSFETPKTKRLLLENDKFVSETIKCKTDSNPAEVKEYRRDITPAFDFIKKEDIILSTTEDTYNSDFRISISKEKMNQLQPGNHNILLLSEEVKFLQSDLATWVCTDKDFKDSNQAVCGKIAVNSAVYDDIRFELLIGGAVLYKKDSITNKNIQDAEFQLLEYNESTNQYEYIKNLVYNADTKRYESGNIYLSIHNPNGKFKIIESKPGKNYINDWKGEEFLISKDQFFYEFHAENQPILGTVKVKKTGENITYAEDGFKKTEQIPLNGVVFGLYPETDIYLKNQLFYPKNQWIANLITDYNGEAVINNLLPGKYYLKETEVSPLYALDETPHRFNVILDENNESNTTDVFVENYLKNCEIKVNKFYYQTDNEQIKLPLEGAKFGLYANEDIKNTSGKLLAKKDSLIQTEISNANGLVSFQNLIYADYYLKEIEAPAGYILDTSIIPISKNNFIENQAEKKFQYQLDFENKPACGTLKIKKIGEQVQFTDSGFQKREDISLANVKFEIYSKDDLYYRGKKVHSKDEKITDIITDDNGEAVINDLVPGDYYLKEVNVSSPLYALDTSSVSFSITKEDIEKKLAASLLLKNKLKNCEVQVFKYFCSKDNEKEKLALAGAKFGLYSREDIIGGDGKLLLQKDSLIEEKYSDKDGKIIFSNLPYADFYLKELEAPKDFLMNDGILLISRKDLLLKNGTTNEYFIQENIINKKSMTNMKITKYGETISGYQKQQSANGEFISYQITKQPLENVTFALYDSKKNLISSEKTNAEGLVYFHDLEPGEYYYREVDCPDAYQMDDTYRPVIYTYDSKDSIETKKYFIEDTVENSLCSCNLTLDKFGEGVFVKNKKLQYNEIPLKDIVFGIYQDFDYEFPSKKKVLKDSCVGYLLTDKNGRAEFNGILPMGKYYIKELKTNAGYQMDMNSYSFEILPNNHKVIEIHLEEKQHFLNLLSKASVQINKTDVNTGKSLKNVEFTLYNEKDEQIGVYKTDAKGKILVENLPYGVYYFIETKSKKGYFSTNNKYRFTLDSENRVILDITNSPILKLGFAEHYKLGLGAIFLLVGIILILGIVNYQKQNGNRK